MSFWTRVKVAWFLIPANVRLVLHGAASSAAGGAFTAAAIYFSNKENYDLEGLKASLAFILAGAAGATALYLRLSPVAGLKFDRAVETGQAVERRQHEPVPAPTVVVLPALTPTEKATNIVVPASTSAPASAPEKED